MTCSASAESKLISVGQAAQSKIGIIMDVHILFNFLYQNVW